MSWFSPIHHVFFYFKNIFFVLKVNFLEFSGCALCGQGGLELACLAFVVFLWSFCCTLFLCLGSEHDNSGSRRISFLFCCFLRFLLRNYDWSFFVDIFCQKLLVLFSFRQENFAMFSVRVCFYLDYVYNLSDPRLIWCVFSCFFVFSFAQFLSII